MPAVESKNKDGRVKKWQKFFMAINKNCFFTLLECGMIFLKHK